MDYIISTEKFSNAKKFGQLYYAGPCVAEEGNLLKVCESSDWKKFGKYDEELSTKNIDKEIGYDDFYLYLIYNQDNNTIKIQTDVIAYETSYYYREDNKLIISDNLLSLISVLKENNIDVQIDELLAKQYIAFNNTLLFDTFIKNVKRMPAASIIQIDLSDSSLKTTVYNEFIMTSELGSIDLCARELYNAIDVHFSKHKGNEHFYIGLSGGLDSRIGAFMALKHGYKTTPFFIGVEKNNWGIRTYDSKRAEEVARYLGLGKIKYYDPRNIPLYKRVDFDLRHAPSMVDNVAQNMGMIPNISPIINGIFGGELFGECVDNSIVDMSTEMLSKQILKNWSNVPRFKSGLINRLCKAHSVFSCLKRMNQCDYKMINELISDEEIEQGEERVLNWVRREKEKGLSNMNIFYKFFYYNFGSICKTSYYSSFSNTIPSLATFCNPTVIKTFLRMNPIFIRKEKPLQRELYKLLGDLGKIRSQRPENSVAYRNEGSEGYKLKFAIEKFVRGSGMNYPSWIKASDIRTYFSEIKVGTKFASKINLKDPAWLNDNRHCYLCLNKIAYLEKYFLNRDK